MSGFTDTYGDTAVNIIWRSSAMGSDLFYIQYFPAGLHKITKEEMQVAYTQFIVHRQELRQAALNRGEEGRRLDKIRRKASGVSMAYVPPGQRKPRNGELKRRQGVKKIMADLAEMSSSYSSDDDGAVYKGGGLARVQPYEAVNEHYIRSSDSSDSSDSSEDSDDGEDSSSSN